MSKFTGLKTIKEGELRFESAPRKKEARPVGKRQDKAYQQISLYMKTDIYNEARRKLIGSNLDFSDLANLLVSDWLQRPSPLNS
jgi:hypothetical protein